MWSHRPTDSFTFRLFYLKEMQYNQVQVLTTGNGKKWCANDWIDTKVIQNDGRFAQSLIFHSIRKPHKCRASKNCLKLLLFLSTEIFSKRRKIYALWRETWVYWWRRETVENAFFWYTTYSDGARSPYCLLFCNIIIENLFYWSKVIEDKRFRL